MKKWTGVVLSLIIFVLIDYYIMGYVVKNTITKNIDALLKTSIMTINLNQYNRGWFSSEARLSIFLHIPEQTTTDKNGAKSTEPPVDLKINVPLKIHHGPFIVTEHGMRFGIGWITTQPETHYGALITYMNNTLFKYTQPGFSVEGAINGDKGQQMNAKWLGIQAELEAAPKLSALKGKIDLNGLSASTTGINIKIDQIKDKFKINQNKDGLWLGYNTLTIPLINVAIENQSRFELNHFKLSIGSGIRQNSLNFTYVLSLKHLILNDKTYGPGELKLSLKNINPQAMAEIHKQEINLLENRGNATLASLALITELPKLLTQGPELELSNLTFDLPEGRVTGYFKLSLAKSDTTDTQQILKNATGRGLFKAPMTLVRAILVESISSGQKPSSSTEATDVSSTVPAVNTVDPQTQADQILKTYTDKGLIKVDGSDYVLEFTLEHGKIMLNGQPFDPGWISRKTE